MTRYTLNVMGRHRTSVFPSVRSGMSLMELMIVIVIVALLALAVLMNVQRQIQRGYDSRKKQDLTRIRTALEEYYNDHGAFPEEDVWSAMNCRTGAGMDFLKPYLDGRAIPCDPLTSMPYEYILNSDCNGMVLLTKLGDNSDLDITKNGCDALAGCGYTAGYNFGLSSGDCIIPKGGVIVGPLPTTAPTVGPTIPVVPGNWRCTSSGVCNNVECEAVFGYQTYEMCMQHCDLLPSTPRCP